MRDVVLTKEMRDKLKKSLGFSLNAEFKYVLESFRKEFAASKALWPVFVLRVRDGVQITTDEDAISGAVEYNADTHTSHVQIKSGEQRLRILGDGIVSVQGYWLSDGSRLSWKDNVLHLTGIEKDIERPCDIHGVIRYFPIGVQIELANAITENETLTEEELRGLE